MALAGHPPNATGLGGLAGRPGVPPPACASPCPSLLSVPQTQEQKTLQVRQFHYLAWPDHGVPPSPDPVLAFRTVVRQRLDQCSGDGTPIVHCR